MKLPTSAGSSEKQERSRETSTSALLTTPSLWLCGSQQTVENSSEMGIPAHWTCLLRNAGQETTELDMEQWTGFRSGKEYIKAVNCHPACLNSMQSTSWEMLGWMKHKLESRLPGETSITSDTQMTASYGRKQRGTKEPLDESERAEWKSWPKTQHSNKTGHGIWSHPSWQIDGETVETVTDYFLGLQNHYRWWLQPWN